MLGKSISENGNGFSLFSNIPLELVCYILTFLPLPLWKQCRSVCSLFQSVYDGENFEVWRRYAHEKWKIPADTIKGEYSIMNHIIDLSHGITTWIGKGTEAYKQPYPMILKINKNIMNNKNIMINNENHDNTIEDQDVVGTCTWPTLRGETSITATSQGKDFIFNEVTVIHGHIAVPNVYIGMQFGFCSVFCWKTGYLRGLAYGIMEDVEEYKIPNFPENYLNHDEKWEGILLTPLGIIVEVNLFVQPSSAENTLNTRTLKLTVKNEYKKFSENVQLDQSVISKLTVPSAPFQEKTLSVCFNDNSLSLAAKIAHSGDGWLDWNSMDIACYPDILVGYVTYANHGQSLVVPHPRHRENLLFLQKVA